MLQRSKRQSHIDTGSADLQREPGLIDVDLQAAISSLQLQTDAFGERSPVAQAARRFAVT